MSKLLQAIVLSTLFLHFSWASAEEETRPITLDEATKQATKDTENKVLSAKTKTIKGKKVHVIKILTKEGRIQHIKIDAASGKKLEKPQKKQMQNN